MLGGDGTFLRAARAVAEDDVPLLGVNLGKVGFLSKIEANQLEATLGQVVAGDFEIDARMAARASDPSRAAARPRRRPTSPSTTS